MYEIVEAFAQSLKPNREAVTAATQFIGKASLEPGYCPNLMKIVATPELSIEIKQAALANLTQQVENRWPNQRNKAKRGGNVLSQEDRAVVRNNIFEAVFRAQSTPILFKLYRAIIKVIALEDIPKGWQIVDLLAGGFDKVADDSEAMGLVNFIFALTCCYEFTYQPDRVPLHSIELKVFPRLRECMLARKHPELISLAVKTYWKAIRLMFDRQTFPELVKWFPILLEAAGMPESSDSYLAKARKNSLKIFGRILKHLQIKACNDPLVHSTVLALRQPLVRAITATRAYRLNARESYYLLKLTESSIGHRLVFAVLEPGVKEVIGPLVQRNILLGEKEGKECDQDPIQFVKWQESLLCCKHPRWASAELLAKLYAVSQAWANFVISSLVLMIQMSPKHAEAGLYLLNHVIITGTNPRVADVIPLFTQLLRAEQPILRARSIQATAKLTTRYSIPHEAYGLCLVSLSSKHIYQRLKAAEQLSKLLENEWFASQLEAGVGQTIKIVLQLLDEVDSERLITSLQKLILKFGRKLGEFAKMLVGQICQKYQQCIDRYREGNEDDECQLELVAEGYLTVVRQMFVSPECGPALSECKETIRKMVLLALQENSQEILSQAGQLLLALLQSSHQVDKDLWPFFSLILYKSRGIPSAVLKNFPKGNSLAVLLECFQQPSQDVWEYFCSCLKTFLQRGLSKVMEEKDFLNQPYLHLMLNAVQYAYKNYEEQYVAMALSTLFALVENGNPAAHSIDSHFSLLIDISYESMISRSEEKLKLLSVQSLCMLFIYNPELALKVAGAKGIVELILTQTLKFHKLVRSKEEALRLVQCYCCLVRQWPQLKDKAKELLLDFSPVALDLSLRAKEGKFQDNNDFDVFYEDYLTDYNHPFYEVEPLDSVASLLQEVQAANPTLLAHVLSRVPPNLIASFLAAKSSNQ